MQQKLTKKLVATSVGLVLLIALIFCIAPIQIAHADSVVWEKVDYENCFVKEITEAGDTYGCLVKENSLLRNYKYLYVFMSGAGGMGGSSSDAKPGYGGGSGSFVVTKINLAETDNLIIVLGKGGGKFEYGPNDEYNYGDGHPSSILALRNKTDYKPFAMEGAVCIGGKVGDTTTPGKGGTISKMSGSIANIIYYQNGVDGGQASHSFSVDLGFRTEHFIYRPTGANPSGKGGGASVYHRGGDGGVMFKNGSDGTMGAGGGGAGKGATQGGYGGDAYMEIYGSNM
ncbi:MAG: hypothetical protein K2K85_04895 [Clostridia bacterium]|nr:hypothetical protein [Clostridia bacterium]MDE6605344.1 hypothetical protein [Clostridia bacterium]